MAVCIHPTRLEETMRTPKDLARTAPTIFSCELDTCPHCHHPLSAAHYVNGQKTVQTMLQVTTIAYRPKVCRNPRCWGAPTAWPSAAWQRVAPKHSTYGYDVIARIGWERQKGREHFATIQAQLTSRVDISESQVRYLYHLKYLPLLACHEREYLDELQRVGASTGLLLSLDGLMPIGGEPQLWVVRELQTGRTLRSGWLLRQDETAFVEFLQPIADLGLPVTALVSDKQVALAPAVARVFPRSVHGFCQVHYFQNAAAPVADADEAMKTALRQEVRADLGELLRPKTLENTGVLTVTGLVPSPVESLTPAETAEPPAPSASATAPAAERERIVQDILHRVRYLLTLKGRPPFRLAGVGTYERLLEVKRCVEQLVRHDPEPRLVQVLHGLRRALKVMRRDYLQVRQAADWLEHLETILDPDGKPARSGAEVQAEWQAYLDQIVEESRASPPLLEFGSKIVKVSRSYAPGLFHTYDVPGLPRTNNERESEFRDVTCRLLTTTGQVGAAKRLLLRAGAWELIPGPASLAETIAAISQVDDHDLQQEQQRVRMHRQRFRLNTRSPQQSQGQLKQLVKHWKALPAVNGP
jgi:hypothetical protein